MATQNYNAGMGTLRFILSVSVVLFHFGKWNVTGGSSAVFGFFILSGYLMPLVYEKTYKTPLPFYANRLLRIMPLYMIYVVLTGIALTLFSPVFFLPTTFSLPKELVMGWGWPGLAPQAWSLAVELVFYASVPVIVWIFQKSRTMFFLFVGATLIYPVYTISEGLGFYSRFGTTLGCYHWFMLGTITYLYRDKIKAPTFLFWPLIVSYALFCWLAVDRYETAQDVYVYGASLIAWLIVMSTIRVRGGRLDSWLGKLSYGVFINHYFIAYLLYQVGMHKGSSMGWTTLALSIPLAYLGYRWIERPIENVRELIKLPLNDEPSRSARATGTARTASTAATTTTTGT